MWIRRRLAPLVMVGGLLTGGTVAASCTTPIQAPSAQNAEQEFVFGLFGLLLYLLWAPDFSGIQICSEVC